MNNYVHKTQAMLFVPLTLPSGLVIPNRLAKAAMEENLCDPDHAPSDALCRLYERWSTGGVGLIVTGNVMIDHRAMTGPGGVVLEDGRHMDRFKRWADAARRGGTKVFMQLNHPGRQVMANMGQPTLAPSAIAVRIPGLERAFETPREMSEEDIADVVNRFVTSATLAQTAGFDGVQVHAAHGYLISQFLSPRTNQRKDPWGGDLASRARLLLETVRAVRAAVGPRFGVAVKLNSADFQRGGFDEQDAATVLAWLNEEQVDLVELSGGSYESPAMRGHAEERTLSREAYFLSFAEQLRRHATMPVMLTGGIRRREVAEHVLRQGIDMVGMATSLAGVPELPTTWRDGGNASAPEVFVPWRNKALASAAASAIVKLQLERLARGDAPGRAVSPAVALVCEQLTNFRRTRQYRHWVRRMSKVRTA